MSTETKKMTLQNFAERRSDGVCEPMTFQKKSRRERCIVRDDVVRVFITNLTNNA